MNPLLVGKVQHEYKWSLKIVLTGGYISNIIVEPLDRSNVWVKDMQLKFEFYLKRKTKNGARI
jgi:hypothetical protein